jgi:2',3'-cyclic-nucleotide 2'-phosphodiesterase (5'-nucleotidase family)
VGTLGGIARAATLIGSVQATEENVLFLHAGDIFIGDFMFNKYFGVPELQILAQLGCDAFTLGNHEFDLTPETLGQALTAAGFPIPGFDVLSANLVSQDSVVTALVQPWVVKDVGNLKVGIFGLTTEETNTFSMPSPDTLTSFIDAAVTSVQALAPQCDLIIGLTHLGYEWDKVLAANVPGIDLIVGGHSHHALSDPVPIINPAGGTTWIVQAGSFYDYVGNLKLECGPSGVDIISYQLMPVDDSVPEVPEIAAIVQSLVDGLEADPRYGPVYSLIIAEAAVDIPRDLPPLPNRDTPMGNLVADAFRDTTGTDVALTVWGFISQGLCVGPLTGADIFQTVPYGYDEQTGQGFRLATFELTGIELLTGLEFTTYMAEDEGMNDLFIQVSGMSFEYWYNAAEGQKVDLGTVLINGQHIDPGAVYTTTTNSGVAGFLPMAGVYPTNLQDAGLTEYEALRDFIVENSPIAYYSEGRIIAKEKHGATDGPVAQSIRLLQGVPNPSRGRTNISYTLPGDCSVRLEVYNPLGQVVATLADGWQTAGSRSTSWDTRALPAGIYVCRFQAGSIVETRKVILLD